MAERPGRNSSIFTAISVIVAVVAIAVVTATITVSARSDLGHPRTQSTADRRSLLHIALGIGLVAVVAVVVLGVIGLVMLRRWSRDNERERAHSLEVTRDAIRLAEGGGRLHRQVLSSPLLPMPRLASLTTELDSIDNLVQGVSVHSSGNGGGPRADVAATTAALDLVETETSVLHDLAIEASVAGTMAALEAFRCQDPSERALLEGFSQQVHQLADRWRDKSQSAATASHQARQHLALPGDSAYEHPLIELVPTIQRALSDIRQLLEELRNTARSTELVAAESAALEARLWAHAELAEDDPVPPPVEREVSSFPV